MRTLPIEKDRYGCKRNAQMDSISLSGPIIVIRIRRRKHNFITNISDHTDPTSKPATGYLTADHVDVVVPISLRPMMQCSIVNTNVNNERMISRANDALHKPSSCPHDGSGHIKLAEGGFHPWFKALMGGPNAGRKAHTKLASLADCCPHKPLPVAEFNCCDLTIVRRSGGGFPMPGPHGAFGCISGFRLRSRIAFSARWSTPALLDCHAGASC
jgi:hypothetical protein